MTSKDEGEAPASRNGYSDDKRPDRNHGNEDGIVCGVGNCQPPFMQIFARISCFAAAYSVAGLFTSTLNVYINSQITTLERQFGFSSSVSGMLMSCNDLGYLLTTLLLSYLARRVHIPRALAVCTLLFGVSGLICTLPFLATRDGLTLNSRAPAARNASLGAGSAGGKLKAPLCVHDVLENFRADNSSLTSGNASSWASSCSGEGPKMLAAISEEWRSLAIACLALGMTFQGFGKSPRHTYVGTYIDDNVPKTKTTLYLGIISGLSIFGPALAFTLGGVFTTMYITLEDTKMSPRDPRFVGAWWLGFLIFGIAGIIAAVPLIFFPTRLRPQPELRALEQKRKRAPQGRALIHEVKEFLRSLLRLVLTPVYMLVVLGNCCALFGVSGIMSFLPKYMETQFSIPPWHANIILGVLNVVGASLGVVTGGCLTSRLQLPPLKCLKVTIVLMAVCSLLTTASLALGCDQPQVDMGLSSAIVSDTNSLQRCQSTCQCDDSRYFPTCGADGVTYFSPCHAGCSENRGVSYGNCSCITMPGNTSHPVPEATPGLCTQSCNMLYPYIAMNFFGGLLSTMSIMPSFIVSVRSVSESDKPLAIGFSAFLGTLLGWFPGPVLFGRIVDSTCLLWTSGCAGSGSCSMYDLQAFRIRYHAGFISTRVANLALYVIALVVASRMRQPFFEHREPEAVSPATQEGEKLMLGEIDIKDERAMAEEEVPFGSGSIFTEKAAPAVDASC